MRSARDYKSTLSIAAFRPQAVAQQFDSTYIRKPTEGHSLEEEAAAVEEVAVLGEGSGRTIPVRLN